MKLPLVGAGTRPRDGRNVFPSRGMLSGEGAQQRVTDPGAAYPVNAENTIASRASYYGQPLLKKPVWKWYIPVYFWLGGVCGSTLLLSAAAQLLGTHPALVRRGRWVGALAAAAGSGLLIADLGRPGRFHHMLRVFRPTSPMNVGAWNLALLGACAGAAAALQHWRSARPLADVAGLAAGLLGIPFSGYTGVLVAASAVPVWHEARRTLPLLFLASAAASTGAALELVPLPPRDRRAARRMGLAGRLLEIGLDGILRREVARHGDVVASPLRKGRSGFLLGAAGALTAASLVGTLAGRHRAAALLGIAGGLALRAGILEAGRASAADPRATIDPQRARADRVETRDAPPAAPLELTV